VKALLNSEYKFGSVVFNIKLLLKILHISNIIKERGRKLGFGVTKNMHRWIK